MTLDVYAQLEQRMKRDHGARFDALVRSADEQMHGHTLESITDESEASENSPSASDDQS